MQSYPTRLPAFMPALPACLPSCLNLFLHTCLPFCLLFFLPSFLHVSMPVSFLPCLPASLRSQLFACLSISYPASFRDCLPIPPRHLTQLLSLSACLLACIIIHCPVRLLPSLRIYLLLLCLLHPSCFPLLSAYLSACLPAYLSPLFICSFSSLLISLSSP